MSAMRSLLNMAAFLSRTVGFSACQLGSKVPPRPTGEARGGLGGGDPGLLAGCITYKSVVLFLLHFENIRNYCSSNITCSSPPESFCGIVWGCECPAC